MIHRIYSTLNTFKEVVFVPGLNLIFADKAEGSGEKQTRNGAGKSSLLDIIHFLCASDPSKTIFELPDLINEYFGMEFDLGSQTVNVLRAGSDAKRVIVRCPDTNHWPVQPEHNEETGDWVLTTKNWERVLGHFMFGLDFNQSGRTTYSPTFRSVFPYFVRRAPGGFSEPHVHFLQSQAVSWQVGISFLLGLDWTIPQGWQVVRDDEESIKKLKKAVGEGDLAEIVGKKAELRSEMVTQETALNRLQQRLSTFEVLPQFRELEQRANAITFELRSLSDEITLDRELLEDLERATAEEAAPKDAQLEQVYREAGLIIQESALRRFEEVRAFHDSVLSNRRAYLAEERTATHTRIQRNEEKRAGLDRERRGILAALSSKGALEQLTKLQSDYGKKIGELELLRLRYAAAEKIEGGLAKAKIERQQLLLRLKQDYAEQREVLNRAIVTFSEISKELYETPALFVPSETTNGPNFKIEVQAERSPGIGHMQIFCFDLMLTLMLKDRGLGPGFLVHDSHLFDPVDARQVGKALELGARLANDTGFQYIVTFNTDKQIDTSKTFNLATYRNPLELSDASDSGGLFGFRFN